MGQTVTQETRYYTLEETAKRLRLTVSDVQRLIEEGKIPNLELDEGVLIPSSAIEARLLSLAVCASLVIRSVEYQPTKRMNRNQRCANFRVLTGSSPQEYLHSFTAGELNFLDEEVTEFVIEAEELSTPYARRSQ